MTSAHTHAVILQHVPPFGLFGYFLMLRLKLFITRKNNPSYPCQTLVLLSASCRECTLPIHRTTPDVIRGHLPKVVSSGFAHSKVTIVSL